MLGLPALLGLAWGVAATLLVPVPAPACAGVTVVVVIAALVFRHLTPGIPGWAWAGGAGLVLGVALRALPAASEERHWVLPQSRLPTAMIWQDEIRVRNVRDFRYANAGEVTRAAWDERRYDLRGLNSAWLGVSPFGGIPGVGHVFVSFGFDDGRYLAISVEARREQGEAYSPVRGIFRNYEIIYVVADERDVVALRSNAWNDPVYLYPVRTSREALRATFLDMLRRANELAQRPEFYDTVFNSCSVSLARHVNRVVPDRIPRSLKVLLAGFSDALALDVGLIEFDGTLEQARERFRINARAAGDVDLGDFSARIRATPP